MTSRKAKSKTGDRNLPPARQATVEALKTKFSLKSSVNFEARIWKMCNRLSENYIEDASDIYRKYAFEKVGCLISTSNHKDQIKVLHDIKKCVLNWDSCNYDEFRRRKDHDQHAEGIKVEKGEFRCRNKDCKSNECYFYQQQDRSGDEGATTYVVCTKCSTRYRFN